jgi:2,3-bisphosphoglycerate-independent phosphoglycerate mutase
MRVLFLFLDGIGLGADDPEINPFARANMPSLCALLGGRRLLADSAPYENERASLLALDAGLGVKGPPQSATGQAVLLTGRNIPAELGYHYGPKPNPEVAAMLTDGGLFGRLQAAGKSSALLNAYPPRYFDGIGSGKRLYSSIPLAVTNAGLSLFTQDDFFAGRGLSADFTGQGWRDMLGYPEALVLDANEAGQKLARLAMQYDFAFFEYWASDYAGHKQDMPWAVQQMETFDGVLAGLLESWDQDNGLILLTSDHGNMEDLSVRRHTHAPVPGLVIGRPEARKKFTAGMSDLTHVTPAIFETIVGHA